MLHNVLLILQRFQQYAHSSCSNPERSAADKQEPVPYIWDAATEAVVVACFHVLSVLIAHGSSCQQAVQSSFMQAGSADKVSFYL